MNTAIKRALQVMEYLTVEGNREGDGVSTIGRLLNIPKSSAFDVLETLTELGYLERSDSKRYRIGSKAAYLGLEIMAGHPFLDCAHRHLDLLCRDTGFTALAGLEFGSNLVIADKVSSRDAMEIAGGIGTVKPIHITALGKAILSCYPDSYITSVMGSNCYVSYTRNSIVNPHQLFNNIRKIRKNGFAVDNFEENEYVYGIAAPVFDSMHRVCGAVGISAFVNEIRSADLEAIAARVMECAAAITEELRRFAVE